jgi:hypothetical protein
MNPARAGNRALAIIHRVRPTCHRDSTSAEERQKSFTQMMEVAMENRRCGWRNYKKILIFVLNVKISLYKSVEW